MKTVHFFSFLLVLFAAFLSNVASAQENSSKTLNLSGFDRLSMGSAFEINVTKGDYSVKVEGRKEDLDDLEANVSGGKLRIEYKSSNRMQNNRKGVIVTIAMPTVRGIDFSGASRSKITGFNDLKTLDLELSGASKCDIEVKAEKIVLNVSGAVTLDLVGSADRMEGEISGATSMRAYEFPVKEASLQISGASNVKINVTRKIDLDVSGASTVRYKGGSNSVRSSTSGASSVKSES